MKNVLSAIALGLTLALTLPACNVMRGQQTAGELVDDVTITTKVKAELLDSTKVDGLDVNVDVNNGKVTLTGWASTSAERSRATTLARAVSGVKSVDNQIKIKS